MNSFVAEYLDRLDKGTDDSSDAETEIGLLLELLTHPYSANRERTTRVLIGDELVDRGMSDAEIEEAIRALIERVNKAEWPFADSLIALSYVFDLRIARPLLKALPAAIDRPELAGAGTFVLNALWYTVGPENLKYGSDIVQLTRRLSRPDVPELLREQAVEHFESFADRKRAGSFLLARSQRRKRQLTASRPWPPFSRRGHDAR